MGDVDDLRVGRLLRALRRRRGMRQFDVAASAHLSQQTVSLIQRGHLATLSIRAVRAVFAAVDARFDASVSWRGGQIDRLLDERHAILVGMTASELAQPGWEVLQVEVTFSEFGERGSIDILGVRPAKPGRRGHRDQDRAHGNRRYRSPARRKESPGREDRPGSVPMAAGHDQPNARCSRSLDQPASRGRACGITRPRVPGPWCRASTVAPDADQTDQRLAIRFVYQRGWCGNQTVRGQVPSRHGNGPAYHRGWWLTGSRHSQHRDCGRSPRWLVIGGNEQLVARKRNSRRPNGIRRARTEPAGHRPG